MDPDMSNPFHGTAHQDRVLEPPRFGWRDRRLYWGLGALLAAGALALLIGALLHVSGAQRSVDRARLTIATVERGTFVRDVAAEGQVVAAVSPTLYATDTGTVTLKVHAGDAVHKGDTLAVLDSPDLSAKLAQESETLTECAARLAARAARRTEQAHPGAGALSPGRGGSIHRAARGRPQQEGLRARAPIPSCRC